MVNVFFRSRYLERRQDSGVHLGKERSAPQLSHVTVQGASEKGQTMSGTRRAPERDD